MSEGRILGTLRRAMPLLGLGIALAWIGAPAARSAPRPDKICVRQCHDDASACRLEARDAARTCADSTCASEVAAAKAACADGKSPACKSARQAAKACLDPCRSALVASRKDCHSTAAQCSADCPTIDVHGKKRSCVRSCLQTLHSCAAPAKATAKDCRAGCSDEKDAAHTTCAAEPHSQACREARAAFSQCRDACGDALVAAIKPCLSSAASCVDACPAP